MKTDYRECLRLSIIDYIYITMFYYLILISHIFSRDHRRHSYRLRDYHISFHSLASFTFWLALQAIPLLLLSSLTQSHFRLTILRNSTATDLDFPIIIFYSWTKTKTVFKSSHLIHLHNMLFLYHSYSCWCISIEHLSIFFFLGFTLNDYNRSVCIIYI